MAAADITPEEDVYLEGYEEHGELSLARYPQDQTSDLKARILVLEYGPDRLVLINLELLFADVKFQYGTLSETFPGKAAAVCGTTPDRILLSNTHTHHAPRRLGAAQEERILQALQIACGRLRPAVIRVGSSHTAYGVSRSRDYSIDYTRPYDDELTVLRVDEEDGAPIGLVFNVPIHNTLYGHGPDLKKNRHLLNCEFTGYACRSLERRLCEENPDFTAMHMNGFYGNAGPIYRGRFYAESLQELQQAGADLAQELLEVRSRAVPLGSEFGCEIRSEIGQGLLPVKRSAGFENHFSDGAQIDLQIRAGAFGSCAYVGVNYEPFAILAARIGAEAPYRLLLPAANIGGWNGYIPTREAFAANEHSPEVECQDIKTPLNEDAADAFCAQVQQVLCRMAGVRPTYREAQIVDVRQNKEGAEYTFRFQPPVSADKVVLSFGQTLRTDCAEVFRLELMDEDGTCALCARETQFSSGFYGVFLPKRTKICAARLTAETRYGLGRQQLTQINVTLTAIRFEEAQKEDAGIAGKQSEPSTTGREKQG